jgi:hypothetical protein
MTSPRGYTGFEGIRKRWTLFKIVMSTNIDKAGAQALLGRIACWLSTPRSWKDWLLTAPLMSGFMCCGAKVSPFPPNDLIAFMDGF